MSTDTLVKRPTRAQLIDHFQQKIRAGEPIIGGGAGTGLDAKSKETGKYRPHRDL